MSKLCYLILLLQSGAGMAQSNEGLPNACRKMQLKPNQMISTLDFDDRYRFTTFLDNGIINLFTRDSLVNDSRQLLDSFLLTLSDSTACEMVQFAYRNRYSRLNTGVTVQYLLKSHKVVRVDSIYDQVNEPTGTFPIQHNQFVNWSSIFYNDKERYNDNFHLYNIVGSGCEPIDKDSLELDSRKNLLRLFKHMSYLKSTYTNIQIFYISQYGTKALYHITYPLSPLKRNPNYYEMLFGFSTSDSQ